MQLEQIEIQGFRGIASLCLPLDSICVLIGENAWGKSSLLDALSLLLDQEKPLYLFTLNDFHHRQDETATIRVVFTYVEYRPGDSESRRYRALQPAWICVRSERVKRLRYCIEGRIVDGKAQTQRSFLNGSSRPLHLEKPDSLARALVRLMPVLRLRDARLMRDQRQPLVLEAESGSDNVRHRRLNKRLRHVYRRLSRSAHSVPEQELRDSLRAIRELFHHYFGDSNGQASLPRRARNIALEPTHWSAMDVLHQTVEQTGSDNMRVLMLALLSAILQAQSNRRIDPASRPLLVLENPETRLHPTMLALSWGFLGGLPMQKLVTTNASEMLQLVPLSQMRRLVRQPEMTYCHQLQPKHYSAEDLRRIAFHVRINRVNALFARAWLLVEGETELWLFNELAQIAGFHLAAEGIRIVEFAQCGLKPLIKFAKDMGVEWHVVTDGDDAGQRYAQSAKTFCAPDDPYQHLTVLPARDMEHYLFENGFEDVFRHAARVQDKHTPKREIINRAINRLSKPGMAIAVAEAAMAQGRHGVPHELQKVLQQTVSLARRQVV